MRLMNTFYYGKAGQADFTVEELPKNRWELFCQTLRVRFSALIGVNLLYVLFCLPALIWTLINFVAMNTSLTPVAELLNSGAAIASEELAAAQRNLMGYLNLYLLGMIPCLALAGLGSTGEMYVLRNWARDDHSFVLSDFRDAIRDNWKCGLMAGALNGLSLLALAVGWQFYGQMAADNAFFIVPQVLIVLIVLLWWMSNIIIYPMMVTYDMKFRTLVRNCFIISMARLPWSALWLILSVALPVAIIFLVPNGFGILVAALLYLLIGFAFTGFVYASYANACFDRFLNPRIEGAAVNKGLRMLDDDDDDDEETDAQNNG